MIRDSRVSSEHCRIESASCGFSVTDLGSRNGTQVNGRPLTPHQPVSLVHGDVLLLGDVALGIEETFAESSDGSPDPEGTSVTAPDRIERAAGLVPSVLPHPIAVASSAARHAVGPLDAVSEILRAFEALLQFQSLVALAEIAASGLRPDRVLRLLPLLREGRPTLGRWLEIHRACARSLLGRTELVVSEFGRKGEPDSARRAEGFDAGERLVALRNRLVHGDGLTPASSERFLGELRQAFTTFVGGLGFWSGYLWFATEPGAWSDQDGAFTYPCRLLMGASRPFRLCSLRSADPLPPRTPIIVNRARSHRLSLAPLHALLSGEDRQLHWFWRIPNGSTEGIMTTYPAGFSSPAPPSTRAALALDASGTHARRAFSGELVTEPD